MTMRAIQLQQFSGPLNVVDVADPVAGPDEVLVDLTYGTINPLDVWCCNGNFAANAATRSKSVSGTSSSIA